MTSHGCASYRIYQGVLKALVCLTTGANFADCEKRSFNFCEAVRFDLSRASADE